MGSKHQRGRSRVGLARRRQHRPHGLRLTGIDRLYALLGGFHLTGPGFEPIIGPTVTALSELAPDVIVPAHCTGWRAQHRLASALPEAFIPNAVGTSFTLSAA
jgi:7,8-dihydropterin-6-yl-methyl-4-(beta-D-ribofuranosyl)aminobenzene 5'-phosphate synthase